MNLHQIASGVIASVNPFLAIEIRVSAGYGKAPTGKQIPLYQTPGAFTASVAAGVMTVSAATAGTLAPGQSVMGTGVPPGTKILNPGTLPNTFILSNTFDLASRALTAALYAFGQVQALSYSDIQHIDALNIAGIRHALYVNGRIEGLVRADARGGDLVLLPDGRTYLTAMAPENWWISAGWTKAYLTQQIDGAPGA